MPNKNLYQYIELITIVSTVLHRTHTLPWAYLSRDHFPWKIGPLGVKLRSYKYL